MMHCNRGGSNLIRLVALRYQTLILEHSIALQHGVLIMLVMILLAAKLVWCVSIITVLVAGFSSFVSPEVRVFLFGEQYRQSVRERAANDP